MVRVRKTVDETIKARQEGAVRAVAQGKPSNKTPEQRKNWLKGMLKN